IDGGLSCVHHTHHLPFVMAETQVAADVGVGKTTSNGTADHNLALPWLEPSPSREDQVSQTNPNGKESAKGDVRPARLVVAREHDDRNDLERNEGFATLIGDSFFEQQFPVHLLRDSAAQLRR